ncbi:MAG TPA: AMP-binding protein [Cyclobacteriaceae bacterium]
MADQNMLPLQVFLDWENKIPNAPFLRQPLQGVWRIWTWKEAGDEIRRIASALKSYNLPSKSKVAILSKNCAHWIMADLAIMMADHISVPIYPTLDASTIQQILEHSETQVLFVGKLDHFAAQKKAIPPNVKCISFSTYGENEGELWDDLIKKFEPELHQDKIHADDLATIMYTSGTSGKPKGVMLKYRALSYASANAIEDLKVPQHARMFSYLPMSHIAERIGIEMVGIYLGSPISFAESLETFPKNLSEVQPNLFFAVPRIWAKFQEKILEKLPQKKLDMLLSIPVVKGIIKKSIKKKLGLAHASHIYTGAAPISLSLLLWFDKLGIEIFQAYAMTENSCYGTFNRSGANRYGTVGQPLKGVDVKIGDDEEILIKHNALLSGYYKEPKLTEETFTNEYFRTGDQGFIDADGFLTITGRIKDLFKTDKGKYIVPSPIEVRLLENLDIEQVCVVGMGIPQPIALIVLSAIGKSKSKEVISQVLESILNKINPTLNSYEQLEKAVIMKSEWTVENGLMTPSLKVKRNEVERIHVPRYAEWYQHKENVVWEN